MYDIIINLLNLEDDNLEVLNIDTNDETLTKSIHVRTAPISHYCPLCGFKMHSRGIYHRTINHPLLQDGYEVVILLDQRRWKCINCTFEANEGFNFINPKKRFSNASDFLIVEGMKDLSKSATAIAKEFKTSAAHVLNVFDKYVSMARLPLTEAICIDEVHLEMDSNCKYVMVIQDFITGEPIDLLISRRQDCTEPYFSSIPVQERNIVKYLISDMYNPYIEYVNKYFPNAISIVDSFHVTQWIINAIINYIRGLISDLRFKIREINDQMVSEGKKRYEIKNAVKVYADKLYLLQHYRWLVTKSQRNIDYGSKSHFDRHFGCVMTIYKYEDLLFGYYPKLKKYRDWKEKYIAFNSSNSGNPEGAGKALDDLVSFYQAGDEKIFKDFAALLVKYREPIINSFIAVNKIGNKGEYSARLSNGPVESLNRKAKDLKRLCRGFRNFDHLRNRFLFATRTNPALNGRGDLDESK